MDNKNMTKQSFVAIVFLVVIAFFAGWFIRYKNNQEAASLNSGKFPEWKPCYYPPSIEKNPPCINRNDFVSDTVNVSGTTNTSTLIDTTTGVTTTTKKP